MKEKRANTVWSPLAAIVLIVFSTCFPVSAAPARIFPIGVWLEASPGSGENFERYALTDIIEGKVVNTDKYARAFFTKCFAKMRAMKFNTVRPSNLPHYRRDIVTAFMELAQQYNLMVIMDPGEGHNLMKRDAQYLSDNGEMWKDYLRINVTDRFSSYSVLWGYAVLDEPSNYQCYDLNNNKVYPPQAEILSRWNSIVGFLAELAPNHADYTVFTSPQWLASAVAASPTSRKSAAYDNYPFEKNIPAYQMGPDPLSSAKGEFNWYVRYKAFKDALRPVYNIPQISVVQTFSDSSIYRYPNQEELRVCVYTSLAAGASGIVYFLFADVPHISLKGVFDTQFNLNNQGLYNEIVALNSELAVIGPVVANLSPVSADAFTGWQTSKSVLAGQFRDSANSRYFVIANKSPNTGSAAVSHSITLTSADYYLTDVLTNQNYQPNASGVVTLQLAPTQGMALKEKRNQSIAVHSPRAGETWLQGQSYAIGWTTVGITGAVSIHICQNSTATLIASNLLYNNSPFTFKVPETLAPGTYYIKVSQGGVSGISGNFTIEKPNPASIITLDKTSLELTAERGGSASGVFRVKNGGSGVLSYSISDDRDWLSVSPVSGTSSGEYDSITVTASATALTAGTSNIGTIKVTSGASSKSVTVRLWVRYRKSTLYRYYNPTTGDHFYTVDWSQNGNGLQGYTLEGPSSYVYSQQEPGTIPLYQYWNSVTADHFYTTNWNELGSGAKGYVYQNIACYVYGSQISGTKPFYRYYNQGTGDHYYTIVYSELGTGANGYVLEGTACYVF